jgi:hypothetical protein
VCAVVWCVWCVVVCVWRGEVSVCDVFEGWCVVCVCCVVSGVILRVCVYRVYVVWCGVCVVYV